VLSLKLKLTGCFRKRIGQVILEKTANVATVVNKTGIIESQFRTFPMEVLAGKDDMNVELKMNGIRFRFNFAKVYWNSRLSEEHERLVNNRFSPGDLILDGFCGVGPFAIRAAKKGCAVQANDLNPESVASLIDNAKLNKIKFKDFRELKRLHDAAPDRPEIGIIHAYNTDAREFLRFVLQGLPPMAATTRSHIVMNLPATAPEFLDALIGAIPPDRSLPLVHCYCFSSGGDTSSRMADVQQRIRGVLRLKANQKLEMEVRDVRDVAPNRYMVCAHFVLPGYLGYPPEGSTSADGQEEGSSNKKLKPNDT